MTKENDQQEATRIERTSGGGQVGGTKFGQQPGEATHSGVGGTAKSRPEPQGDKQSQK